MQGINKTDYLVIGSGIAGLSFALRTAKKYPYQQITVFSKKQSELSNSNLAQGGIAIVTDTENDSAQRHFEDTIKAGDGACNEDVVKMVIDESVSCLEDLMGWTVEFDKNNDGEFSRALEGGHTANRVLHKLDSTGSYLVKKLLEQCESYSNIRIKEDYLALDLLKFINNGRLECAGAQFLNRSTGKVEVWASKMTVLSTGGLGYLYNYTTNPAVATGDGLAMACRAGAVLKDLHYIQFHPTALYQESDKPLFLISEAVRGAGAILRKRSGRKIMKKYHEMADLAPRDVVSRAIHIELQKCGDDHVILDCRRIGEDRFKSEFPGIYNKCKELGIDPILHGIPVIPAAHYACGGITTDMNAATSIRRLYACGECASTGLHGANRLASNSLLEAVVFSNKCFGQARIWNDIDVNLNLIELEDYPNHEVDQSVITSSRSKLRKLMTNYVGIVRSNDELQLAYREVNKLIKLTTNQFSIQSIPSIELRNMLLVARHIIRDALDSYENRGSHYNVDL